MAESPSQHGIHLKGEVSDDVDMIRMAPDKIQRVLTNLVDNAIKYTRQRRSSHLARLAQPAMRSASTSTTAVLIFRRTCLPRLFESFLSWRRLAHAWR